MGRRVSFGITPRQLDALNALGPELDRDTYLVGGVAVAMRLHHRISHDLDLFVPHDFDADALAETLASRVTHVKIMGRARGTLHVEVDGVPVSILSYRYPLLAPPTATGGLPVAVASAEDLACMKISAIAGRGAAKDFWDLDALLDHGVAGGSLRQALELYERKFSAEDIGHAVRSLAYFAEADAAPLPLGLTPERWSEIKDAFARRVKEL